MEECHNDHTQNGRNKQMNNGDIVLTITWSKDDFCQALKEASIPINEENIRKMITEANCRMIEEKSIQTGWEIINAIAAKI